MEQRARQAYADGRIDEATLEEILASNEEDYIQPTENAGNKKKPAAPAVSNSETTDNGINHSYSIRDASKNLDNSSPVDDIIAIKDMRGDSVDDRGVRERIEENTGNQYGQSDFHEDDGGRYSRDFKNPQAYKDWGNLSTSDKRRITKIVDEHIGNSENYDEIFSILCRLAGVSEDESTPRRLKQAISKLAEQMLTDAITLHPVIYEN